MLVLIRGQLVITMLLLCPGVSLAKLSRTASVESYKASRSGLLPTAQGFFTRPRSSDQRSLTRRAAGIETSFISLPVGRLARSIYLMNIPECKK